MNTRCQSCGHDNDTGGKFCTMCGSTLASATTRPNYYEDRTESEPRQDSLMLGDECVMEMPGLYARAALLFFLTACGAYLIYDPADITALPFMKLFNFPFDFSGKFLGQFFLGKRYAAFGGLLMMFAFTVAGMVTYIFQKRDAFGAAFFMWWSGQVVYITAAGIAATYNIAIWARSGRPVMRDSDLAMAWRMLINKLTIRNFTLETVWLVHGVSIAIISISLIWMTVILVRQFKRLR